MTPELTAVMALAAFAAGLIGYGLYVKHKIRQSDRRIEELEALEAVSRPASTAR